VIDLNCHRPTVVEEPGNVFVETHHERNGRPFVLHWCG
jgi:hypothetical protein